MGKFFVRRLTERNRNVITILEYMLTFCCAIAALILFGISLYILIFFSSKAHLLGESFSFTPFGLIYIFVSALICIQECGLCFVHYYSRQIENRKKLIENGWMDTLLYSLIFSTFIAIPVVLLYSTWFVSGVSTGFLKGMKHNLKKFDSNRDETIVFNRLQFDYQCCGAKHYEDWKEVILFGYTDSKDNVLKLKSVPFSCCKTQVLSLCYNDLQTGNYSTINTKGCAHLFNGFILKRIYSAIAVWVLILFFQFSSFILFQYWKTSLVSAFKRDRSTGRGYGWLYLPFIGEDSELLPLTTTTGRMKRKKPKEKVPIIPESGQTSDNSPADDYRSLKRGKIDELAVLLANIPYRVDFSKSDGLTNKLEDSTRYWESSQKLDQLMTKQCETCLRYTISIGPHLCLDEQNSPSMAMIAISDYNRFSSDDSDSSSDIYRKKCTEYQKNYQTKPTAKPTSGKTEAKSPIDSKFQAKFDPKNNKGMTTTDDDTTQTDPTKRKYKERYFILKEIR